MDQRNVQLAKNLINYSVELKQGEKILIECKGTDGIPLLNQLIKEAYRVGGLPFAHIYDESCQRELLLNITEQQLNLLAEVDIKRMEQMDAYIGLRAASNTNENADVPSDNMNLNSRLYSHPVHTVTRLKKKWVVLRYPNYAMAQLSGMSTEAFANFYYEVCNLDYSKLDKALDPLKELMEKTDKVRIVGKDTDISFSIANIPVKKCAGKCNIPDGEIYTAPVRDSVNGKISYNTPSEHDGFVFENISLEFKDGKIINATANDSERINKIFDMDEGSRYIGEFALGVNPYISNPMKDILFDEKISGSFHLTPGSAYEEAYNGNNSALHWDLVCIQTPKYGGGEIYFDDVLIRKDGVFVVPELAGLNPENF